MTNTLDKTKLLGSINKIFVGLEAFDAPAELFSRAGCDELKIRQSASRLVLGSIRQGILEGAFDLEQPLTLYSEDLGDDTEDFVEEEQPEFEIFCLADESRSVYAEKTFPTRQAALDFLPKVQYRSGLEDDKYEIREVT